MITVDFDGHYYKARECLLKPRGPRPTGPPIMVGTKGHKMLRLTARYADIWNVNLDVDQQQPRWRATVAPCSRLPRVGGMRTHQRSQRTTSSRFFLPPFRPCRGWASSSRG